MLYCFDRKYGVMKICYILFSTFTPLSLLLILLLSFLSFSFNSLFHFFKRPCKSNLCWTNIRTIEAATSDFICTFLKTEILKKTHIPQFLKLTIMMKNFCRFKDHSYLPGYGLRKIKNPSMFQGNRKRKKYFEGWYFKMVSASGSSILSVIPGISLSNNGKEQHAFIQIIDGKTAYTYYYDFPIKDFYFSQEEFAIRIGDNYFSEDSLILDIHNNATSIKGEIKMSDQVHLSHNRKKRIGIMGWYQFVPFMQCYHGVVSLNHRLNGTITMNNETYNFDNGQGYIEKDWGRSMPSS